MKARLLVFPIALFLVLALVGFSEKAVISATTITSPKVVLTALPKPGEVDPGETVTVDITIQTVEEINASSVLVIYVNDKKASELLLSPLPGGAVLSYQFNFTPTEPGYYVLRVELREELHGGAS